MVYSDIDRSCPADDQAQPFLPVGSAGRSESSDLPPLSLGLEVVGPGHSPGVVRLLDDHAIERG